MARFSPITAIPKTPKSTSFNCSAVAAMTAS
jgi:hypothetical protein